MPNFGYWKSKMKCSICRKIMDIFEGLTEMSGKKCHISCKEQYDIEWKKQQGLDRKY
jgi:hypothetical protein